jgi:hypothetical protein
MIEAVCEPAIGAYSNWAEVEPQIEEMRGNVSAADAGRCFDGRFRRFKTEVAHERLRKNAVV